MQDVNLYYTKDLMEAAAITCAGAKLLRLESSSTFYYFVFSNKNLCEQLSNEYWSGTLQLSSAKAFADSFRSLKDRLFAKR